MRDLLELLEDSLSHIYVSIPHLYHKKSIMVYKLPKKPFRLSEDVAKRWHDMKWVEVDTKHIEEHFNKNKWNMAALHSKILDHILAEHYYMEHRLKEIEDVVDNKTISKYNDDMKVFKADLSNVVNKVLRKPKLSLVKK